MKHLYINLSKLTLTLAILLATSVAGFAATIVIAAGTTQSFTSGMSGTTIEVYGTLNFNSPWANGDNGANKVIVYNGGTIHVSASSSYYTSFDIKSGAVMTITGASFSMGNGTSGIINAGTVNAANTDLTLNSGAGLNNSGTVKIKAFTLNSAGSVAVPNKNTGTLEIGGSFTNNSDGKFENVAGGTLKVAGSFTNNGNFTNSGTMTIVANAVINSAMILNGSMTVGSNLVINNAVTGTNGTLTVTNGNSVMNSSGKYTGTNMRFDDKNTTGNDFDVNWSSTKATNIYFIGGLAASILPLRFLSFEAVAYNHTSVYFKFTTTVESSLEVLQLQGSNDGKNYITIESFTPHNANGIFAYVSAKTDAAKYNSYRIAVINLDGNKEYSKTVFFQPSASAATVETSIYPNPVTNATFNVKVASVQPAIINVYSNDGKILYNTVVNGQQQYQVQLPASASHVSLLIIQVIQNGTMKSFNVLNK